MALPKPSSKPLWTQSNPSVRVEPSGSKKNTGWGISERPAREFMNWLFYILSEWTDYFESVTDSFIGYQTVYAAFVGSSGLATHSTLTAAISAVPAGSKILVLDSSVINTIQSISKNDLIIEFMPGVIYSKGTAAAALQIQADRCRIIGGHFQGFNGVSDAGIIIDSGSDFTKLRDCHFQTCTVDVDDQSATSSINGATSEV